jgi:hypothetical protein
MIQRAPCKTSLKAIQPMISQERFYHHALDGYWLASQVIGDVVSLTLNTMALIWLKGSLAKEHTVSSGA